MIDTFAMVGMDGEVYAIHEDRAQIEQYMAAEPLSAAMCSIVEVKYNDDPVTERGLELEKKIKERLKDVRKFHINKQVGFYEMHIDDRYQLIYDILTREGTPFEFGDSNREAPESKQPEVDLEERFSA